MYKASENEAEFGVIGVTAVYDASDVRQADESQETKLDSMTGSTSYWTYVSIPLPRHTHCPERLHRLYSHWQSLLQAICRFPWLLYH